jgi:acyl-CoA dehydrogenase
VISGRKWFITGADGARFAIIMARTGNGSTMFLTDMRTPGIRVERVLDTLGDVMPGGHGVVSLD